MPSIFESLKSRVFFRSRRNQVFLLWILMCVCVSIFRINTWPFFSWNMFAIRRDPALSFQAAVFDQQGNFFSLFPVQNGRGWNRHRYGIALRNRNFKLIDKMLDLDCKRFYKENCDAYVLGVVRRSISEINENEIKVDQQVEYIRGRKSATE